MTDAYLNITLKRGPRAIIILTPYSIKFPSQIYFSKIFYLTNQGSLTLFNMLKVSRQFQSPIGSISH
ncbi:hypothetical protein ACU8KH_05786 [Lachancea thermotolerans]